MSAVVRTLSNQAPIADLGSINQRAGRQGESYVHRVYDSHRSLCDEGSVWTGVNATSETGISASVATQYSGTASAYVALRNTDTSDVTGKRIYPLYMKFRTVTAPASATRWLGVIDIDNVLTRFTSGGTAITPANANMTSNNASIAALNVGALTTVAISSAGRVIARPYFRSVIPVVGDDYLVVFGGDGINMANDVINGSNPCKATIVVPPVVLGASHVLTLSVFGASNSITGWATEFEIVWVER